MLEKLLQLLAEGGLYRYEDLMNRLGTSRPMLEAMIEELARLGYLRPVNNQCGHSCTLCPKAQCLMSDGGRLWTLTEKGSRALPKASYQ